MPFQIVHNDITKMNTDAIVNAANSKLLMGSGVCGAIFKEAGAEELQKECNEIGHCDCGCAVITKGYKLKAKYVIHTVGPIWRGGAFNEAEMLKNAYINSLNLAKDYNLKSISFPLISSGIYGYPNDEALNIAVSAISEFLLHNEMDIYLVVFDRKAVSISEGLFKDIKHYIDKYYEIDYKNYSKRKSYVLSNEIDELYSYQEIAPKDINIKKRSLDDILNNVGESFSEMLLRLIDEKGKSDVEVYKKANMDRKLFSKIRSNKGYSPKKSTALSLAIVLELSLDETKALLSRAGYSLSPSQKFDIIIQYFIENEEYDIFKINEALFCFEQPLLAV